MEPPSRERALLLRRQSEPAHQRRVETTPAVAVGKRTLTESLLDRGPPNKYQQAIEAARRELRAVRTVALPAYVRLLRRKDLADVAKQIQVADAAMRVRHLLMTANQHVRALEQAMSFRDPMVLHLRHDLATLAARATKVGVYRGAEDMKPQAYEEPSPQPLSRGANALVAKRPKPRARAVAAVQRKSTSAAQVEDVRAVAAQGIAGATAPLPHLGRIQQAFGRHDVSHVRVQIGGTAAEAAHELGATAYASGSAIAFKSHPDLHTAAHEAAHVIQQRAGVSLTNGLDERGDRYEQHADRVADAVVRGESAEALLDQMAAGGAIAATGPQVVQRKADAAVVSATKPDVWWAYFRANEDKFVAAIENRLSTFPLVEDKRLTWRANGLKSSFQHAVRTAFGIAPLFSKLPELLYPADPMFTIDAHRVLTDGTAGVVVDGREPQGPMTWNVLAGEALATDVVTRLRESFARMVPRYLVQVEEKHPARVTPPDLVTSHPMDRVTTLLLCDEHVVSATVNKPKVDGKHDAKSRKGPPSTTEEPTLFKGGVRFLQSWRWLGDVDTKLWNYVEVKDPDATPEDVAVTLWLDPEKSYLAFAITQSGPFFRVEPRYARKFVEDPSHSSDEPHKDNVLDLASSALATDAAIAQAKDERKFDKRGIPLPPDLETLAETLEQSHRQLFRTRELLGATKLWELLVPALQWVTRYREHLFGLAQDKLIALTPVIEGQQEVLFESAGAIAEIAAASSLENLASPGRANAHSAVIDTLREYAIAMGESHLVDSARAQLRRAQAAKASLALALLEESARDTGAAVQDLVGKGGGQWGGDHEMQYAIANARIADLRAKQAGGRNVDPKSVAVVAATLKEQGIDAKSKSLYYELSELLNAARDSIFGSMEAIASIFDGNVRALPGKISAALDDLRESVLEPHERVKQAELQRAGSDEGARAAALDTVSNLSKQNLDAYIERHELKKRIAIAIKIIEKQQKRTAIAKVVTQIAILIGASMVGGVAGNMVAGYVRGALVADAATASVGMLRAAQTAGFVAGLGVDAGINAGVQLAVHGGSASEAFVGNLLGTAAVRTALAPLTKAAQTWGHAVDEIKNVSLWQKTLRAGKLVAKQGAVLTTSMIVGAATDYVVQRAYGRKPPSEKEAVDWAIEGGSLAIGMFVGQWLHGFEERLVHFAEYKGQLQARTRKLRSLMKQVETHPDKDVALELMIQRHEALQEEGRIIEQLAHEPHTKVSPEMLRTLRTGNQLEMAAVKDKAFDLVPLRLAGLQPDDASGMVWTGHRAQIEMALEQSRRLGIDATVLGHDRANGTWRLRYNNKEIAIVERHQRSAVVLAGNDAELRSAAASIKPLTGYQDVVVHGTIDDFEVLVNGKIVSVDHRGLARYVLKSGGGRQKVRLLSCETGKHAKGAAQHLANKLGVEVIAPNDLLHVFEDSSMVIGPTPQRNTGSWETFVPTKAARRFTQWKERAPERAIDRFHRARAETAVADGPRTLGDDSVERRSLNEKSDLGDAIIAGLDYADRASSRIGGNLEPMVKDIALRSVVADLQAESGLRVLDTLFGKNTSAEMKRAAAAIDRAHDARQNELETRAFRHADDERDRLQKEMVDVMRDPSLAIDARKAKLRDLLAEFETAVRGSIQIDPRKIAFAQARKAIDDLRPDVFENMITIDASGDLTRKAQRVGTFRELMEQVRQTNAAYQRHGIEEEFVISVSTPVDPKTPREVKILTRKPRKGNDLAMGAKRQTHAPVDPSNPSDEGLVVDIGVGMTDYAREVGGEQGMVVKTEFGPDYVDPAMMRRDLTWQHTAPHVDVDSVVVLGDALQTLPILFGNRSVKRLFINNINASYAPGGELYFGLARGLRQTMKSGGRVELQWTTALEATGGVTRERGHVTGEGLKQALAATAADVPRAYSVNENAPPVTDYDFSVSAPRTNSGTPSKAPPTNPVPEKRWIFTFGD